MATMKTERPKFLPSFLELLRAEVERTGWFALVPYGLLISIGLGVGVALVIPKSFWHEDHLDVSTVVFTGIMTLDGLILALGWNAFGRVYDTLSRGDFGAYLMEKNLLNDYLIHINVMHWAQITAVVVSGIALVAVLVAGTPLWLDRILFGLTVVTTIYGIKQAVVAITAMNDLVWQAAAYENLRKKPPASPFSSVRGGRE